MLKAYVNQTLFLIINKFRLWTARHCGFLSVFLLDEITTKHTKLLRWQRKAITFNISFFFGGGLRSNSLMVEVEISTNHLKNLKVKDLNFF